jgi:hypothetical protein
MHDINNWESLVVPFAETVCKMSDHSSRILGKIDDLQLKILYPSYWKNTPTKVMAKFR